MNHKLLLIQRTIALLIILTLVVGILIIYLIENYPKIEVRYVDRIITNREVVTEYKSEIEWDKFIVTAYTQYDDGCNNLTAIGLDLNKDWTRYFNFVAVDPSVIPYGKTIFIKIDGKIIEALAVDCGYAIKGNRLDLYCGNLEEAFSFGIKEDVPVGVIK